MTRDPHHIGEFMLGEGDVIAERYELGVVLGSGAGTFVFRARDYLTGEEIAVKLFRVPAPQAFQRELGVLRGESHPNVVRILDFGETQGTFYVAMELVRGEPLSRVIADGSRWPHDEALGVFERVTNALAWLHSRGVVHGDMRPSNIVWNAGAIKLMEFGTQRYVRQVTSARMFSSPERLLGRPLTASSDIYSVAAVIYRLLIGEPPHAGTGLVERATAHAPRLCERAPDVPEALAGLLEACLNADPALRPASASEIAEQCRLLLGRSVEHSVLPQASGPVLALRIGEKPLEAGDVSALLLNMCGRLREIHDAGLAHPDLSPRNIRLLRDGRVDIETFPAPPPNATLMMTEPKYAAPEMLLTQTTVGGGGHVQSDIYVLGFVSYEALAGRDAFRRQLFEDEGDPETDFFWMKWHADPARRLQPLSEVNATVPQEISALIQRMIEKDPAARLKSLDEVEIVLTQLRRRLDITGDIELAALAESAPSLNATALPSRRRAFVPLLLACLLSCGAAAWWRLGARNPIPKPPVGDLPRSEASRPAPSMETAGGPMVLVPSGSFVMGNSAVSNEAPARTVFLPAFYIDKYEVSNARYRAFTDSAGYFQPPAPSWDADYFEKGSHPVLNVSWRDAQAFCVASGKRLPSEAEWEKAARGSSPGSLLWANWTVTGMANLKRVGSHAPAPIGSFPADVSPFGAFDMAGNVHEWVNDQYDLYNGNPVPLNEAGTAKVVRGGSFALSPTDLSPSWRASFEASLPAGEDSPVGFRCAADPKAPKR